MSIGPWRCIYGIVYRNLQPLLTPRMFHEFHVKPLLEAHMSTLLGASRRGRWQFRGTHVFRGARVVRLVLGSCWWSGWSAVLLCRL